MGRLIYPDTPACSLALVFLARYGTVFRNQSVNLITLYQHCHRSIPCGIYRIYFVGYTV